MPEKQRAAAEESRMTSIETSPEFLDDCRAIQYYGAMDSKKAAIYAAVKHYASELRGDMRRPAVEDVQTR